MVNEKCLACGHDDPHAEGYTLAFVGWTEVCSRADCECSATKRDLAAANAEIERLKDDLDAGIDVIVSGEKTPFALFASLHQAYTSLERKYAATRDARRVMRALRKHVVTKMPHMGVVANRVYVDLRTGDLTVHTVEGGHVSLDEWERKNNLPDIDDEVTK